jgi:hypothetical protein
LAWSLQLAPDVASFVRKFDGKRTLAEMAVELAGSAPAPEEEVRRGVLSLAKRLVDQGFLKPEPRQ